MKSATARLLVALAVAAVLTLGAAVPAWAAPADDPLRALGGDSPLCASPPDARARERCARSGAIEHPYPLDRYRFDWHIDTGLTNVSGNLAATVQWIVALLWTLVLYSAKAVLLAFQWSFSLDLLSAAMQPASRALARLHQQVLGPAWQTAAIVVLGLGALWSGIVRRRHAQTAATLLVATAMMACALAVIAQPAQTIGAASRTVNAVKIGVLAGATQGTLSTPAQSLQAASRRIFDAIVLRPWCAIEFADVGWCLSRAPGDRLTRAERWLRYPVASKQRDAEYDALADPGDTPGQRALLPDDETLKRQFAGYHVAADDTARVAIQQQNATLPRAGLVALIALGVFGWVALLGWLSVQSLLQAMLALVLLLGAPVMLLAPAFGARGRSAFATWASRLFAAVCSGVIYALMLAIVITLSAIIGELDVRLSWLTGWLVQLIFFWGVFFKRAELLGWLSVGTQRPAGQSTVSSVRNAKALARDAARPAIAAATTGTAVPLALTAAAAGAARSARHGRSADRSLAIEDLARGRLEERARQRLEHRYQHAHTELAAHDDAQAKLRQINTRLRGYDQRRTSAKPGDKPAVTEAERALVAQRKALEQRLLPRAQEGVARRFVETADRNLVEQGRRFTDQQVALQLTELRDDLDAPAGADDERHAWRLERHHDGTPASTLADLTRAERDALHQGVADDLARDRALFAALPRDGHPTPSRGDRRQAATALPDTELAAQARARRRERRDEPPRSPQPR